MATNVEGEDSPDGSYPYLHTCTHAPGNPLRFPHIQTYTHMNPEAQALGLSQGFMEPILPQNSRGQQDSQTHKTPAPGMPESPGSFRLSEIFHYKQADMASNLILLSVTATNLTIWSMTEGINFYLLSLCAAIAILWEYKGDICFHQRT